MNPGTSPRSARRCAATRACWALIDTASGTVAFRRVPADEAAARAIEVSDLLSDFADELREARGYRPAVSMRR